MERRDASRIAPFDELPRLSIHDLALFAIPMSFLLGAAIAGVLGYSFATGIKAGGVVAVLPTAYALFAVPPTGETPPSGSAQ